MSLSSLLASTTTTLPSSLACKNPLQQRSKTKAHVGNQKQVHSVISCEQKQLSVRDDIVGAIDRRNVLLGLGGLCGATATIGSQAIGAPVQPPDLSKCHEATDEQAAECDPAGKLIDCCPPYQSANPVPFVPPCSKEQLRVRKPAHMLTPEEIEKFQTAIAKMKALDKDDPWNFMQQATIHCTYCNGAFDQKGFPGAPLQVHGSWLFLPWHRFYIYFWERILGKLIDDSTFAIPFWNWDIAEGMRMPKLYLDKTSPLYNDTRNPDHYNALMDFRYNLGDPNPTQAEEPQVIASNLKILYNTFTEGGGRPDLFLGGAVRAGETKQSAGSLENLHNVGHSWTGPVACPNHDMGNFATAARDTMFYGHHANVDRLWAQYQSYRGNKPDFTEPDFLNASFIFYDENRQMVTCKVSDCLETTDLRYAYAPQKLEWKESRKGYKKLLKAKKRSAKQLVSLSPVSEFGSAPRSLDQPIRALVPRPKVSRSKSEKEDELEILVIDDIEILEHGKFIRFDVYISKPIEQLAGPDYGEIAGSFIRVPHGHRKSKDKGEMAKLEIGITNVLDDIEAESSESLVVTLVPGSGKVTIGSLGIKLEETDV